MPDINKIKIYLLEDEVITREALKESLENLDYEVCGSSDNAQDALDEIKELKPDLAILDINIRGDKNGIWVGSQLSIPFIYLTAYIDKNTFSNAGQTKPSAFLIKPFEAAQVDASIFIALSTFDEGKEDEDSSDHCNINGELFIKESGRYIKLNPVNIYFLHTKGKYIFIHTYEKKYIVRNSLSSFLEKFQLKNFIQIHKSYAINIQHVKNYSAGFIKIVEHELPLSRTYKQDFFAAMSNYAH